MFKNISNYFILSVLILSIVTHVLRILYLFFEPQFLKKYKVISDRTPTKVKLILYYVLTVGVSVYVVNMYIIKMKTGT